jgi:leader peptidase (prepilin peptidase) / N-methyltransferase
MSTAAWSAVGCAVAGAAVGGFLPATGGRFVRDWRTASAARPVWALASGMATSSWMGMFGLQHDGLTLIAWCWLTITGVCLALVDIECHRLPHVLIGAMTIGGLGVFVPVAIVEAEFGSLVRALLAVLLTVAGAAGIALAAPGQLGAGDVKLLAALALYLGWCGWHTVVLGLVLGFLLTGIAALGRAGIDRTRRGTPIAAGPTLILGALVAIAIRVAVVGTT